MGMFDWVECKRPLPDGWDGPELQTKSLDCVMDRYTITEDGRLLRAQFDYEKGTRRKPLDIEYHGRIRFYGSETVGYEEPKPDDALRRPIDKWHEYEAKFTDGKLTELKSVHDVDGPTGKD